MRTSILFLLFLSLIACESRHLGTNSRSNLNSEWEFKQNKKEGWMPAEVPGLVHLDLLKNGVIEEPYRDDNEIKLRWIENEDWTYRTEFDLSSVQMEYQQIELCFEGIDTYASIRLNGRELMQCNNQFRTWNLPIKTLLQSGTNRLEIAFESPINRNRERVQKYPHALPAGNESADIPIQVSPFTRKAAYHFGWDWGPRFVSSGIWKPVKLKLWNQAIIREVNIQTQNIYPKQAVLKASIRLEVDQAGEYAIQIGTEQVNRHLEKGMQKIEHVFEIGNPKLWWCNGMGKPKLYTEIIQVWKDDRLVDRLEQRFGIRQIELVQEEDSIGHSFYFRLNGKAVFMKGANYIPQDLFLPRVKDQQYRDVLQAAKEANMNMLRVWGGGIYEQDLFYDLCDELGLLVWQDLMFAGSLYPADADFLNNVKEEIKDNVRRLRHHPSIALWCGNNEIEVAWKNWGWQEKYSYSPEDSVQLWNNYKRMFHEEIPALINGLDPERNYTPSSPLSNWGSPENFNRSSMHYWGVWHGREDFAQFEENVGRFMVEYGFQSYPSLESLRKSISEVHLSLESEVLMNRQKSYIGNEEILKQIETHFEPPRDFTHFVELSQETQALALKMAIDAHRKKEGHCMGSLFWQLNDCWPGPSWSVIDYYGEKKKGYKAVQESFAN